jgi:hypothetical protein
MAAGEHPDWDEYRSVMVTDRRVLIAMAVDQLRILHTVAATAARQPRRRLRILLTCAAVGKTGQPAGELVHHATLLHDE